MNIHTRPFRFVKTNSGIAVIFNHELIFTISESEAEQMIQDLQAALQRNPINDL